MADASCRLASLGRPCRYTLPSSTSVTSQCRFRQLKLSWHPMCEAPAQIISRKPMVWVEWHRSVRLEWVYIKTYSIKAWNMWVLYRMNRLGLHRSQSGQGLLWKVHCRGNGTPRGWSSATWLCYQLRKLHCALTLWRDDLRWSQWMVGNASNWSGSSYCRCRSPQSFGSPEERWQLNVQ